MDRKPLMMGSPLEQARMSNQRKFCCLLQQSSIVLGCTIMNGSLFATAVAKLCECDNKGGLGTLAFYSVSAATKAQRCS